MNIGSHGPTDEQSKPSGAGRDFKPEVADAIGDMIQKRGPIGAPAALAGAAAIAAALLASRQAVADGVTVVSTGINKYSPTQTDTTICTENNAGTGFDCTVEEGVDVGRVPKQAKLGNLVIQYYQGETLSDGTEIPARIVVRDKNGIVFEDDGETSMLQGFFSAEAFTDTNKNPQEGHIVNRLGETITILKGVFDADGKFTGMQKTGAIDFETILKESEGTVRVKMMNGKGYVMVDASGDALNKIYTFTPDGNNVKEYLLGEGDKSWGMVMLPNMGKNGKVALIENGTGTVRIHDAQSTDFTKPEMTIKCEEGATFEYVQKHPDGNCLVIGGNKLMIVDLDNLENTKIVKGSEGYDITGNFVFDKDGNIIMEWGSKIVMNQVHPTIETELVDMGNTGYENMASFPSSPSNVMVSPKTDDFDKDGKNNFDDGQFWQDPTNGVTPPPVDTGTDTTDAGTSDSSDTTVAEEIPAEDVATTNDTAEGTAQAEEAPIPPDADPGEIAVAEEVKPTEDTGSTDTGTVVMDADAGSFPGEDAGAEVDTRAPIAEAKPPATAKPPNEETGITQPTPGDTGGCEAGANAKVSPAAAFALGAVILGVAAWKKISNMLSFSPKASKVAEDTRRRIERV